MNRNQLLKLFCVQIRPACQFNDRNHLPLIGEEFSFVQSGIRSPGGGLTEGCACGHQNGEDKPGQSSIDHSCLSLLGEMFNSNTDERWHEAIRMPMPHRV